MNRICLVIHSLGIGGMERVMSLLANDFATKKNTEVHLVLIGIKRQISYPLSDKVIVHRPGFTFKNSRRLTDTFRTMRFIRKRIKNINPDTILSFGEVWNNLVLLSLLGLRYPVYISDRSQPDKDLGKLNNILRRTLYPKAKGYIAQTVKAKAACNANKWNSNIKVIGNPIRNVKRNPSIEKENIVLTVGRLIDTKHMDHLIKIFSKINPTDWRLVIVGGDAKKLKISEQLNELIINLGMERKITLEGNQKDVDTYYNRSKLFAYTSSSEGFPNVVGEALSAGLPVVAYDSVAGLMDMVEDGRNGYLVPLFRQDIFEKRLKELMEEEVNRKRMSRQAKKSITPYSVQKASGYFFKFITQGNKRCK